MKQILLVVILGLLMGAVSGSVLTGVAQQPQPPLDISGIALIQAIPVGGSKDFVKEIALKILNSLANLAVMQSDVEKFIIKAVNPYTEQEEEVIGGEFGRILRHEILGINPKRERLGVDHIEFVQTPGLTPKFDEDKFKLDINGREIDLTLARDMGKPEKGFPEWGVHWLLLKRYVPNSGIPPKTEELSLFIDYHKATYIRRILAPDGTLLAGEKWEFVPGNPNPVSYSKYP